MDHSLVLAIADGSVSAREFGVLEIEENDFFKNVINVRKGEKVTPSEVKSGPFRERFYRECSRIGKDIIIKKIIPG